jgi:hypothetical protein
MSTPFPIPGHDAWKLQSPPRFEDHPGVDPEPEDDETVCEPTPLEDQSGGGPVGETQIIPAAELRRSVLDSFHEGAD